MILNYLLLFILNIVYSTYASGFARKCSMKYNYPIQPTEIYNTCPIYEFMRDVQQHKSPLKKDYLSFCFVPWFYVNSQHQLRI